ncbi:hypothetical protein SAMN05660748_4504 [Blastococcus aggregatus]|uniref:Uncharacterized protein n=1 Tax=Blastococcus aggregatus TaxID=38502 RepID=A0A285VHK0_9ACTN|nr:hypothetical protein [Blastococcus aggregatus]SOC53584.1 hypothetical protein SAMN05660748_4504 [Blastococcus aggregatus]
MATILAHELFTATDSSAHKEHPRGTYLEGSMRDVTHAQAGDDDRTLCGRRAYRGPDGTVWPARHFTTGTAELCPVCAAQVAAALAA